MSIAATRMYRSLTDFTTNELYAFRATLLRSALLLTTAEVTVHSVPLRSGPRQVQIPNESPWHLFRSTGSRYPCTDPMRIMRPLRRRANMGRMEHTSIVRTVTHWHKTNHSRLPLTTTSRTVLKRAELTVAENITLVLLLIISLWCCAHMTCLSSVRIGT